MKTNPSPLACVGDGISNQMESHMAKIKVLRVVARTDSFRRAGFQFSAEPKDIPMDALSKVQLAAIVADGALVATEIEVDEDDLNVGDDTTGESDQTPPAKPAGNRRNSRG